MRSWIASARSLPRAKGASAFSKRRKFPAAGNLRLFENAEAPFALGKLLADAIQLLILLRKILAHGDVRSHAVPAIDRQIVALGFSVAQKLRAVKARILAKELRPRAIGRVVALEFLHLAHTRGKFPNELNHFPAHHLTKAQWRVRSIYSSWPARADFCIAPVPK